jgi:hypothetical protein
LTDQGVPAEQMSPVFRGRIEMVESRDPLSVRCLRPILAQRTTSARSLNAVIVAGAQYVLGFEAPVLDGQTHTIKVDVKGEGLTARARRSYLAALPTPND